MRAVELLRRAAGKPPGFLARRALREIGRSVRALWLPSRLRSLTYVGVAAQAGYQSIDEVSESLTQRGLFLSSGERQQLRDLYGILGDITISPRKLKESLDKAVAVGVSLDGAVFTIVDRAIARDPTAFIPSR